MRVPRTQRAGRLPAGLIALALVGCKPPPAAGVPWVLAEDRLGQSAAVDHEVSEETDNRTRTLAARLRLRARLDVAALARRLRVRPDALARAQTRVTLVGAAQWIEGPAGDASPSVLSVTFARDGHEATTQRDQILYAGRETPLVGLLSLPWPLAGCSAPCEATLTLDQEWFHADAGRLELRWFFFFEVTVRGALQQLPLDHEVFAVQVLAEEASR
ncbi:MAG: hypothetical protein R3A51_02575 [Nannocystaceae bacterium]